MMRKRITALLLVFSMLIVTTLCLPSCTEDKDRLSFTSQEYHTNLEPLQNWFPALGAIEQAHWKRSVFGRGLASCIGPTCYRLTGFAVCDAGERLWNRKYSEVSGTDFPDGIDPEITGFTEFQWRKYPDFTEEMLGNHYIGLVLIDIQKGLVYFDVENL